MNDLNWKSIVLVVIACLACLLIGFFIAPSETTGYTDAEVKVKVGEAVNQSLLGKNIIIDELNKYIEILENKSVEDEEEKEKEKFIGYLIDELYLSDPLEDTYSDREVKTLFDGEIDFDGKDYDAEETLILKDIELLANKNDFEGNVYMTLLEGTIEYKFEFDLDTSLINEEETLEFNFLGKEVEISVWDNDTITIFRGTEMIVDEGETVDFVEGYKISLISVTDDSVYLSVTDSEGDIETKIIDEDKTKSVNGLKIRVDDVFSSGTKSFAELIVGTDIEIEVANGEEYEEDSIWEWKISVNSVGLVLVEGFTEIDKDGDEEFPAVGINEKLCLPNDYVCVGFNGMDDVDTQEYLLELDEKSGNEYVRIKGNFISGIEDYNRIYVNSSGIYDRDLELIDSEEIELTDTDSILDISTGDLVFEDFAVNMDLNSSEANGNDLNSEEEDWLTDFGLKIVNPEDSAEDQEFNIFVPEERISGSITLI